MGAGDDSLFAGSYPNDVNAGNTFNGNVTIDGGAGSDSALIKNPSAPSGATRNNTFNGTITLPNVEVLG